MFDYVLQNPGIHRRRHAMKPDEAAFLKQNPPKLDVKTFDEESSCNPRIDKANVGVISQKVLGTIHGSSSSMADSPHKTSPQAMDTGYPSGSSTYVPFNQQRKSILEHKKSDDSSPLSETMKLERSDHKRKFGALSEDDDEANLSATAIDIVHPSEIEMDDGDFGGLESKFWENHSVQVLLTVSLWSIYANRC